MFVFLVLFKLVAVVFLAYAKRICWIWGMSFVSPDPCDRYDAICIRCYCYVGSLFPCAMVGCLSWLFFLGLFSLFRVFGS